MLSASFMAVHMVDESSMFSAKASVSAHVDPFASAKGITVLSDTVSPFAQMEQEIVVVVSLKVGLITLPKSTVVTLKKEGQQSTCAANATSAHRNSSASRDAAASEREAHVSPPATSRVGSTIVALIQNKHSASMKVTPVVISRARSSKMMLLGSFIFLIDSSMGSLMMCFYRVHGMDMMSINLSGGCCINALV